MTPSRRVAATASLIGAVCGCGASTEPDARVTAMVPDAAFNDAAFSALIAGDSFRPAYSFDTMAASSHTDVAAFSVVLAPAAGGATVALDGVNWQSSKALAATVPAGVPAGSYDVVVTDPRGTQLWLAGGFLSLGSDDVPPTVTIDSPTTGSLIGEGTTVTVMLSADDGEGLLQTLGATVSPETIRGPVTCAVPAGARNTHCSFQFVAPAPTDDLQSVSIGASATDSVGNLGAAQMTTLRLAPRPTLISASRDSGPASGGTEIVVQGDGFIENATQMLIDGRAVPTLWLSSTTLQGTTLAHDPGTAIVSVTTAGAESLSTLPFTFIGGPIIRIVCPLHGPLSGGTKVTILGNYFREQTLIYFGGKPIMKTSTGPARIEGIVPPGAMVGPVSISATDPVSGYYGYQAPFTYDPDGADDPDAGAAPPICNGVP
jgi:hypothetical protein